MSWVQNSNIMWTVYFLVLKSLLIIHSPNQVHAVQDEGCNNCVDPEGKSCDEFMRRFAASKYWVPKDDSPVTFSEAVGICSQYGFMVAEIASPGELNTFENLAKHAGHEQYWVGATSTGNGLLTPDNVALAWQPPFIFGNSDDENSAISVDLEGNWMYTPSDQMRGAVCQYPWNHRCLREHLDAVSGRVNPIGTLEDPNNSGCDQPYYQSTQFIRAAPNSKYLMPKDLMYVSHLDAYRACRQLQLEPAEVATIHDLIHLTTEVVQGKNLYRNKMYFQFALGAFDLHQEGVYTDLTTNGSMKFQAFDLQRRNQYYDELKNCLSLQCVGTPPFCYHANQFCNEPRTSVPLCQYKRNSPCYLNSPLGIKEKEQEDKLMNLGSTAKRNYYGSTTQKSVSEAKAYCASFNFQLLDFIMGDVEETLDFKSKIISEYRSKLGINRWIAITWTSAYFPDGYSSDATFRFENGVEWDFWEGLSHFNWLPEIPDFFIHVENPFEERCVVLFGGGTEQIPFYARPVVCNLQNYFVCYDEIPEPTEQPETTTEPSSTTEMPGVGGKGRCNGEPVKISFDPAGLLTEEVEELIKDSQKYNFSMDYAEGMKIREESAWRLDHVKGMGWLTQKICPDEHVPREYVNLLMNFIMIFYHNAKDEKKPDGVSAKIWETMGKMYAKCGEETESIEMRAVGGLAKYYQGEDGDEYPIYVEEEIYDSYEYLDFVMEGMWFMHQVTAAACYKVAESKSRWVTDYHLAFRNDWTEVLREWWVQPSESNYGLLFGDMELHSAIVNLRSCAQVAFTRLGIQDRMFPRPLTLDNEEGLVGGDLNSKIGHELVL